jgi:hypothetical protein
MRGSAPSRASRSVNERFRTWESVRNTPDLLSNGISLSGGWTGSINGSRGGAPDPPAGPREGTTQMSREPVLHLPVLLPR